MSFYKCGSCASPYDTLVDARQCCSGDPDRRVMTDGGVQAGFDTFDEPDVEQDDDEADCPRDVDGCEGPEMLEDGELCCAGCWIHDATRRQIAAYESHPETPDPEAKYVGGDAVAE